MTWTWVLSLTILGTPSENGELARFDSRAACQQSLVEMAQREAQRGREVVGTCFLRQQGGKGWWQ